MLTKSHQNCSLLLGSNIDVVCAVQLMALGLHLTDARRTTVVDGVRLPLWKVDRQDLRMLQHAASVGRM